jgi:hypothetical protein
MESRVKTSRLLFAAVAFATLATTTSLARHGAGKPASLPGAAHHESAGPPITTVPATNTAGDTPPSLTSESETKIGRAALPTMISGRGTGGETGNDAGSKASHSFASSHGIDLLRPDGGYASPGLRRRATRSSLIAKSEKRNPTIATPGNLVVHPPTSPPGAPAQFARSAIGVIIPGTSIQNLGVIRQSSGVLVNANAAKTSIGGNAGEIRHENPHPAAMAGASLNSTGLNGAAMGHPTSSPATLGGPAHIASGIGGAIIHSKH